MPRSDADEELWQSTSSLPLPPVKADRFCSFLRAVFIVPPGDLRTFFNVLQYKRLEYLASNRQSGMSSVSVGQGGRTTAYGGVIARSLKTFACISCFLIDVFLRMTFESVCFETILRSLPGRCRSYQNLSPSRRRTN